MEDEDPRPRVVASVGIKLYDLVDEAVRDGVTYGYRRAHKHTDTPTEDMVIDAICSAVMSELLDIMDL